VCVCVCVAILIEGTSTIADAAAPFFSLGRAAVTAQEEEEIAVPGGPDDLPGLPRGTTKSFRFDVAVVAIVKMEAR
jgi:hypothetical protein